MPWKQVGIGAALSLVAACLIGAVLVGSGLGSRAADLRELGTTLAEFLGRRGIGDGADVGGEGDESDAAVQQERISGTITSRADVVRTIDLICDYYARNEPSSPVPILLRRAKRLVDKGFMDIVRDLTPGGVTEAETFAGLEEEQQ